MTAPKQPRRTTAPALVNLIAERLPASDVIDRLLTDPRMSDVWRKLSKLTPNDAQVDVRLLWFERDSPLGLTRDIVYAHPPAERGAAALFVSVVDALGEPLPLRTHAEYDAQAKRFADAVELCTSERKHASDVLRDALDVVARHFARRSIVLAQADGAQVVERSGGDRGDDTLRIQARFITAAMFHLYGKRNVGVVANVLAIATDAAVKWKDVDNWTRDIA
jgi:hypothetical protein